MFGNRIARGTFLVPALILLLIITAELATILVINDGHFIYTLDDTYIHLALAENIERGHYGVNFSEVSSPSSSILWPFLLAPFMSLSFAHAVPLIINVIVAIGTLLVYARLVTITVGTCNDRATKVFAILIVLLLIPMTNLVGQVFLGMEHSLQTFFSALIVLGLVQDARSGKVAWWLPGAILAGPLVRYDTLALSVPAILYLVLRGHIKAGLLVAFLLFVGLVGFSTYLLSLGLSPLPNSVMYRTGIGLTENSFLVPSGLRVKIGISTVPTLIFMPMLLVVFALVALTNKRSREERLLAATMAISILLQIAYGQIGSFHRLEMYMWLAACLLLIYLVRLSIRQLAQIKPFYRSAAILLIGGALMAREYTGALVTIPLASNNIYEQQYQMHRFATEFYDGPIAVNDLGWVAYNNDNYVLDLVGLASHRALWSRFHATDPRWMTDLAAEQDVRVAMLYDFAFEEFPSEWRRLGVLHLGKMRWVPAGDRVTFYAFDEETEEEIQPTLSAFQKSLPEGVVFEMTRN